MTTPRPLPPTWRADLRIIDLLGAAACVVDADGVILHHNVALELELSRDPAAGALTGRSLGRDPGAVREVMGRVLSGETWAGSVDLGVASEAFVETWWSPAWDGDAVVGALVCLACDDDPALDLPLARSRLTRLGEVTGALLVASSLEQVADLVTEHITQAAGAVIGSLSVVVDDDTLALVALRGGAPGAASRWATYPLSGNTPAAEATRRASTVLLVGLDEIRGRYPDLEGVGTGERSLLCLPLTVNDRAIGVVTLSFPGLHTVDAAEMTFLRLLADTCAQAIDRLAAQREAADREDKLRFLAEASARLAGDLDYESTLTVVAEMAVPWFADWCSIALEEDGHLRTLSVAHAHPEHVELVEHLQATYPPAPDAERGAYRVLRTGVSDLIPEIPDELLAASSADEEHLRLLRLLEFRSALAVPLKSGDRVLGVITWVTGEHGRRFTEGDRAFGEDLALRAAVAIDSSQLHSQLRESALRLQQAVLPQRLPKLPGWDVAFQYLPAGRSGAGGDFFDLVPLDDDRIAFFVGDVMGRGVEATTVMAQMRSAMRTLIAIDPRPAVVMRGLDLVFERWQVDQLVTVVYGIADPNADVVQIINAGHPEPLLVLADGTVETLTSPDSMILGAGGGARGVASFTLPPGADLMVFTDGLVERRDEDADVSVQRLIEAAPVLQATPDLTAGLALLVDEVRDHSRDDDVAALVLRRLRA